MILAKTTSKTLSHLVNRRNHLTKYCTNCFISQIDVQSCQRIYAPKNSQSLFVYTTKPSDFDTKWLNHVLNSVARAERKVINNWAKVKSINFRCVIENVYIVFANSTLPNMRAICFLFSKLTTLTLVNWLFYDSSNKSVRTYANTGSFFFLSFGLLIDRDKHLNEKIKLIKTLTKRRSN